MPLKRKRTRPRKNSAKNFRTCEKCKAAVENGISMYRYHRTGLTVCTDCWLSTDPVRVTNKKRKILGLNDKDIGTKLCAVILKDVLVNPSKYEKVYKVEQDDQGNTTYLVTDDNSENEEKQTKTRSPIIPKVLPKRTRKRTESVTSTETIEVEKKRSLKRTASTKSSDNDYELPTKRKPKTLIKHEKGPSTSATTKTRTRNGTATSDSEVMKLRSRRNSSELPTIPETKVRATSASDVESQKPQAKKRGRPAKNKNEEKLITESVLEITKRTVATKNRGTLSLKTDNVKQPMRKTRANSVTADQPNDSIPLTNRMKTSPKIRSKTKSLSLSSAKSDSDHEKQYTCNVCQVEYKNKLLGMAHELSHSAQPTVKLERVVLPEMVVTEETAQEPILIEEPEETEEKSQDANGTSEIQISSDSITEPVTEDVTEQKINESESNDVVTREKSPSVTTTAQLDEEKKEEETSIDNEKMETEEQEKDVDTSNENERMKTDEKEKDVDTSNENERMETDEKENHSAVPDLQTNDDKNKVTEEIDLGNDGKEVINAPEETEAEDEPTIVTESEEKKDENVTEEPETSPCKELENSTEKSEIDTEKVENDTEKVENDREEQENDSEIPENDSEKPENDIEPKADTETDVKAEQNFEDQLLEDSEKTVETPTKLNGVDTEIDKSSEGNKNDDREKELEAKNEHFRIAEAYSSDEESDHKTLPSATSELEVPENKSDDVEIEAKIIEDVLYEAQKSSDIFCEEQKSDEVSCEAEQSTEIDNTDDNVTEETQETAEKFSEPEVNADENTTNDSATLRKLDDPNDEENLAAKKVSAEASDIAEDIFNEVFNLATATVNRRLQNENLNITKGTNPIFETIESISQEIRDSADMPSLDILDDSSSNILS